ncbi:MBL fold metallo-hydrolase [Yoonia litorea]|uniref:L-ascorbate metabolism protein UlaG, beta-lactamase superfamily n=1 Tax=Yoonia litorea TaxID=1123755 RepID=A0A1I6N061_9RHOB|nr:MBL fold metallo-hydrolase [Yoonia litorea]SFS21343.1 L-ascorbate metabolism protein UlaG, beta-lactamase superfamily [Yoonia litorea]
MRIKWYGQAAFMLTSENGLRVATDPYTPHELGYSDMTDPADVVLTSSDDDSAHCRYDLVPGSHIWLNTLDVVRQGAPITVEGITVDAVEAMEIEDHPLHEPGANAMYRFALDGMEIGHMGDIGNDFNDKQLAFFEGVDILLTLAGGIFTTRLDEVKRLIDHTKPKLVIPMHFRTLTYKPRNLLWIESFLSYFDEKQDVDFAFGCEAEVTKDTLPERTRVLVMDYAR